MKTNEELVAYLDLSHGASRKWRSAIPPATHFFAPHDILGTIQGDLAPYLPWELARKYYNQEYAAKVDSGEEVWTQLAQDKDEIIAKMRDYMPFAIGKAEDGRGLSASRSIDHYTAWLFLLGDDRELPEYPPYGLPILHVIAERYGFRLR